VANADGRLTSLELGATGPRGGNLTIDIAWFGSDHPRRVLVHTSGVHGVEAFTGSAIQLQWLSEGISSIPADGAIVIVHVLNPYGMAWLRRFNERNVDLNRNFLEPPYEWSGKPVGYDLVDGLMNPTDIRSLDFFYPKLLWLRFRLGANGIRQAISSQYVNAKGLFYGGSELEEGPSLYKAWLRENLASVERLYVIDVHTGLGPWKANSLFHKIVSGGDVLPELLRTHIVPDFEGSDVVGYGFRGGHVDVYRQLFTGSRVDFITQEFGTFTGPKVLKALRAENKNHHYGETSVDHPSKVELRNTFFPDSYEWRESVRRDGMSLIRTVESLVMQNEAR
jgi:hypothetical protein